MHVFSFRVNEPSLNGPGEQKDQEAQAILIFNLLDSVYRQIVEIRHFVPFPLLVLG